MSGTNLLEEVYSTNFFQVARIHLLLNIGRAVILEHQIAKACFRYPGAQKRLYRAGLGRSIAGSIRDIVSARCYCLFNPIAGVDIVVTGPNRA